MIQKDRRFRLIECPARATLRSGKRQHRNQIRTEANEAKAATSEALILDIAMRHFFVETLETRNSDGLDFQEVAVWALRAALQEAYAAGFAAAKR